MAEVMEMLALSPTMEEGTLAEWHKAEGDTVKEGEILADVETDKATMEMESFFSGTILKLLAKAGDTVRVGQPLVIIGEEGEDISALLSGAAAEEAPAAEEARAAEEAEKVSAQEAAEERGSEEKREAGGRLKASPLAKKIAEDKGIDLGSIQGSGPGGRIIKRDVEGAEARPAASSSRPSAPVMAAADLGDVPGQLQPLSQMRKTISRRLAEVWQSTPHFYLTKEIDMASAMAFRKEVNAHQEARGGQKVSVNDLIVKAAAAALRAYPAMNSAFTADGLMRFDEVNIGVAVAVEDGLITPTIRRADQKNLSSIATEIRELAGRAREKKLRPEEYSTHTFSISNLGMYGIDEFMAVINAPDAAILACGSVQKVPVVEGDEIVIGTRMKVTLACDHRAVDGATGAEFLQHLQAYLEDPMLMLV